MSETVTNPDVEQLPIRRDGRVCQTRCDVPPRPGRQRAHTAQQTLGRASDQQDAITPLEPEHRPVTLRFGKLGSFDRERLRRAAREAVALFA